VPDRALAQRTSIALRPLLRGLARRWHLGLLAAFFAAVATPSALLAYGTARARACVASYDAPRGPELPDCLREVRWLITPSRIPWTATRARYRAEELGARTFVAAYDDAAVGRPDAAALRRAADGLALAQKTVHAGSQRLVVEELGRAVGAPDPGLSAVLAGDRRTLVDRADAWEHWSVRLRALEAALLEGDGPAEPGSPSSPPAMGPVSMGPRAAPNPGPASRGPRGAAAVAQRYAEFDPRDEELRIPVGAALCLEGAPERGGELLLSVQASRARERHESWARNWGEVRALIVACAAKAGAAPPPMPERTEGGEGDQAEARTVLRLRILTQSGAGDSTALRLAAFDAIQLLKTGPLAPGARVRVLAALLASGHALDEHLMAELSRPHLADEAPLLPGAPALTALDWLAEPRGLRPAPGREALRDGADKLRRAAASPEVSPEERLALETAAAATAIEAVRAFALAGDAGEAARIVDDAGDRALPSAAARALARSSARYVAGDPARALAEIEGALGDLDHEPALRAAWHIQKAELLASTGQRDAAARAAVLADEEAAVLGDRSLEVRARWTRLALAHPPLAPLRAEPPPPLPGARNWPWTGEIAAASWFSPGPEGAGLDGAASGPKPRSRFADPVALARALGFWDAARRAPPEERRADRYAAFTRHAGDAPRAFPAYLAVAAELLQPGEGDVEVWLDAFAATSSRKLTLRAYAWARGEAARFRGDATAAARWAERYGALVKKAAGPGAAELAAALGI
jgi:hypothetical protein